jgi:hypothetical protein
MKLINDDYLYILQFSGYVPEKYRKSFLSDGKEVMKINDKLLYFTNRGILDNFSGYVFSPDGKYNKNAKNE